MQADLIDSFPISIFYFLREVEGERFVLDFCSFVIFVRVVLRCISHTVGHYLQAIAVANGAQG